MSTRFTEVFPIQPGALPPIYAYRIKVSSSDVLHAVGGGIPWAIRRNTDYDASWVWSKACRRLLTPFQADSSDLETIARACRRSGDDRYRDLRSITADPDFQVSARAQADFMAWGQWHQIKGKVRSRLNDSASRVDPVHIRRYCTRTPHVVDGQPALQLSVHSEVTHQDPLITIYETQPDLVLEGLAVKDRTKSYRPLKGTIEHQPGSLGEYREDLLDYGPPAAMQKVITNASDKTPVVSVVPFGTGQRSYKYVLDALDVIVQPRHYDQLNIPTSVQNKLTLSPEERVALIQKAAAPLQNRGWLDQAYRDRTAADVFGTASDLSYPPKLQFGSGSSSRDSEEVSIYAIRKRGVVTPPSSADDRGAYIHVVETTDSRIGDARSSFGKEFIKALGHLGLRLKVVPHTIPATEDAVRKTATSIAQSVPTNKNGSESESGADQAVADGALFVMPDRRSDLYRCWKQATVQRGLPNQVVQHNTLNNEWAIDNIALGLAAKMGGVPYVLKEPLPYTDRVVGLDIGRRKKQRAGGTISVAASAHLYAADGRLLQYCIEDASVEGETVPPHILRRIFPEELYGKRRVLIHRDGPFRGQEVETLQDLANEMDSTFHLVEVRKQGAARLYQHSSGNTIQAAKGDYFKLDDHTAFLASSPPPSKRSTARPLHIKVRSDGLSLEEALHSVLSLTLVHHGSVRPPRLPVTLHYADRIAERLQNGVRPPDRTGNRPYWL